MSSLRGQVRAGSSRRDDFPLRRSKTALLVVDVQTYVTSPPQLISPEGDYLWNQAVPRMVRNLQLLLQAFRAARDEPDDSSVAGGCEVIFTYLQAATNDGRDISLDYKLSGPQLAGIPRVGEKDLFLSQLQPDLETGKGDILLPKTSCSVFQSTNLNYLLRNLGIDQLVVAGQLTDQCVESAVRDAADLGYFVTVAEDACAAKSMDAHRKGLDSMQGFSRILATAQVIEEIAAEDEDEPKEQAMLEYLRNRGLEDAAFRLEETFEEDRKRRRLNERV